MVEIINPYDGVDEVHWHPDDPISGDDAIAHKSEMHFHDRGHWENDPHKVIDYLSGSGPDPNGHSLSDAERYTVFGMVGISTQNIRWPWTDLSSIDAGFEDRDPEQLGVVAYPGQEYREPEHVQSLFSTVVDEDMETIKGEENWPPDDQMGLIEATLEEDQFHVPEENGGIAVLSHPSAYFDCSVREWDRYTEQFNTWTADDGLLGLEIFGRRERDTDDNIAIDVWDDLLLRYAPGQRIYGFGASDKGTRDTHANTGDQVNRWFQTICLTDDEFDPSNQVGSQLATIDAMTEGRMFSHWRDRFDDTPATPPKIPKVTGVAVGDETITLSTEDTASIEWISKREVVETGETIAIDETHYPYVRAELESGDDAGTLTQPFMIDAASSVSNSSFGNATF